MHPALIRRVVYPLLHGRRERRTSAVLATLERTQWWSREELESRQWDRLQALLRHAAENVPYYREVFRSRGLRPEDIRGPGDLRHLPVLDKQIVRDRSPELIAAGTGPLRTRRTSGSTGIPLVAYSDAGYNDWLRAAGRRRMRWWGLDIGTRTAYLGTQAVPWGNKWKRYLLYNEALVNCTDLSPAGLARMHARLVHFRAAAIRSRPSALTQFANFLLDALGGRSALRLKVVWSTAEFLYPDQRAIIADAFRCPVVNEYGSNENGLVAVECPQGQLHIMAENVYVEFLPVPQSEGLMEILVTNLHNWGMPFIRYAIGDLGAPIAERCPCGRGLPLLALTAGRTADVLVLPGGRLVDQTAVMRVLARLSPPVRQFRIIQEDLDRFSVLLVADEDVGRSEAIRNGLERILGFRAAVDVRLVDVIPPEAAGKLRRFISRVAHPAVRYPETTPPAEAVPFLEPH